MRQDYKCARYVGMTCQRVWPLDALSCNAMLTYSSAVNVDYLRIMTVLGAGSTYVVCCRGLTVGKKAGYTIVPSFVDTSDLFVVFPERDYVTFGSLLPRICLSSVCNVRAPTQGVEEKLEASGNISSPLCTLTIL